jgi:hypothetical protein
MGELSDEMQNLAHFAGWGGTSRPSAFAVLRRMTKLELRRLHHQQVGWLLTAQNTASVDPELMG